RKCHDPIGLRTRHQHTGIAERRHRWSVVLEAVVEAFEMDLAARSLVSAKHRIIVAAIGEKSDVVEVGDTDLGHAGTCLASISIRPWRLLARRDDADDR